MSNGAASVKTIVRKKERSRLTSGEPSGIVSGLEQCVFVLAPGEAYGSGGFSLSDVCGEGRVPFRCSPLLFCPVASVAVDAVLHML